MGHGLNQHSQSNCAVSSIIRDTASWGTVGPDMDNGFGILKETVWSRSYRTRGFRNIQNQSAAFDMHGKLI